MKRNQDGFTLMELMVTLSIVAILVVIAIPGFTTTIKDNRITGLVNEFVVALNFTRSEAIKRGVRVSMCKGSDGTSCVADGAASNWSQGWIIFTDLDVDAVYDAGTETIVKVQGSAPSQITIIGNTNVDDIISYKPNGLIQQAGSITFCDDRTGENGKRIAIASITGRPQIQAVVCS
jgi:type IV fimbrial biogenesis protein FimT